MTSISHEPSRVVREKRLAQLLVPEMWASLAIVVIWLSVLATAIWGPDIVTNNGVGDIGERTTVPSAVVVSLFAFLATWVVAKYGFRHGQETD
ncbi:MAG: hypothetical protein ACXWWO_05650 [Candidatus Limnocylindria bacterium]